MRSVEVARRWYGYWTNPKMVARGNQVLEEQCGPYSPKNKAWKNWHFRIAHPRISFVIILLLGFLLHELPEWLLLFALCAVASLPGILVGLFVGHFAWH